MRSSALLARPTPAPARCSGTVRDMTASAAYDKYDEEGHTSPEPRLHLVPHWAAGEAAASCGAAISPPCDRPARPGRSDGLCNAHRAQEQRGKPLTIIRAYKKPVAALPRDLQALLDDLFVHGSMRPYDRKQAARRLGCSPPTIGARLARLIDMKLIRKHRTTWLPDINGHRYREPSRYEVLPQR